MKEKRTLCRGCPAFYDPCLWSGDGDNPAQLVVIGLSPSGFSIGKQKPFYGRSGRLFKSLLDMIRKYQGGKYKNLKVYFTYATMVGAFKPKAGHLESCQVNLFRELNSIRGVDREPVIVTLGSEATKAVGLKIRKISQALGREMNVSLAHPNGTRKLTVVPLLSMAHLEKKIGTANVVLASLLRAVQLACDPPAQRRSLDDVTINYMFPNTIEEVSQLVDHIIDYYNPERGTNPGNWYITLDTETNTLRPYSHPDPKTLMLSVSWDEGKAAAILLDHPDAPYDPKEAWKHVARLLRCQKPKVFHNWKFDRKFITQLNGIEVNNVKWDTMLGEHFIDEDKKGFYGLKKLVPLYAPEYEGYDETLQNYLRGQEEDEKNGDNGDEEEEGGDEQSLEPLYLDDAGIVERHLMLGCPEDRDDEKWQRLVDAATFARDVKGVPKKKRTTEQTMLFNAAIEDIKRLRKELEVRVPKKEKKPKEGDNGADKGFEEIPLATVKKYAAVDADVTRIILQAQYRRIKAMNLTEESQDVMGQLYLPGSNTLSKMEYRGFAVNQSYLKELVDDVQARMLAAENLLHAKFEPTLKINSPKQVSELMARLNFEKLPGDEDGGTGKDILSKYAERYPEEDPRHLFVTKLREFREAHKTLKTYLIPIRRLTRADGKMHCQFHLNGTATGRLSSSDINMQNIPLYTARRVKTGPEGAEIVVFPGYNIKKLFVPSQPGNVIVNVDIKGAELRVYTAYSHDPLMIDALQRGVDVHSLVTSKVYKLPYEEIQQLKETDPDIKEKRTNCKRVVFGTFYGAGPWKISQQIGSTVEAATELQQSIFNEFPAIRTYVDDTTRFVQSRGFVKTVFGRCRRFRMAHVEQRLMAEAIREAVNFLIQSTSSDLVLSQLCEIDAHLEAELGGKLLITVHDSLTFEMPEENVGKLFPFLDHWITERVREKYSWMPVDFLYDVEVGPSYGELKPLKRAKKEEPIEAQKVGSR